jgi:hypothetical protein
MSAKIAVIIVLIVATSAALLVFISLYVVEYLNRKEKKEKK